jgi:uncharacterized damage-inducible protein DinB
MPKPDLRLDPLPGHDPVVGLWLAALEESRGRTKKAVDGLDPRALDWTGAGFPNSIGSLLAHVAAIEMDWLFSEILEREIPADVLALLPADVRDAGGRLVPVVGLPLAEHLRRLDATRAALLARLRPMDAADLRRPRRLERYDVTPEWVLHHLLQHEAEHRGQVARIRGAAAVG